MKQGTVRIIAGQWRGRRLKVPDSKDLRPTPDRVRETLFNWLAPWIAGAHCLDLFRVHCKRPHPHTLTCRAGMRTSCSMQYCRT